jgi:hypothetical protein
MVWLVTRLDLRVGQRMSFVLAWSTTKNEFVSVVPDPIFAWLQERNESAEIHFKDNDAWLEFEDANNATLFKLTWGANCL